MKKVLHIFDHYLPTTERWAFDLISEIKNHEVHVGARIFIEESPTRPHIKFCEASHSDIEQRDLETSWKRSPWAKTLIKLGKLNSNYKKTISTYIKNKKIDLIHAHFGNVGWEMVELSKRHDVPLIVSFYGLDYDMIPFSDNIWKRRYTELFKAASLFLVEGDSGKDNLVKKGCPSNKVHIQRLGIQINTLNGKAQSKKKASLNLVQLASFTEKKGQLESVKAIKNVINEHQNLTLTLIGNARNKDYQAKVSRLIKEARLEDHVFIKPFIPYDEISDELQKYDAFIQPSKRAKNSDSEGGIPTLLFHAAASSLPIIATNHCDIPDLVSHEISGLLSEEGNVSELAENILRIYFMGEDEYSRYCKSSFERVVEKYSIGKNVKNLENLYSKVNR